MVNEKVVSTNGKQITIKNIHPTFATEQEKNKQEKNVKIQLYDIFKKY